MACGPRVLTACGPFVSIASSPSPRERHHLFEILNVLLLSVLITTSWAQSVSDAERLQRTIVVGTAIDSYPKSFLGPSGRCEGFSVDVLDAVARVMDLKIERVTATSSELRLRFQNGQFDLLETYSPTSTRATYADFSDHYLLLHGAIFVRKGSNRIKEIKDLNDAALLLSARGSIGEQLLNDYRLTPKSVRYCSSTEEAVRLLDAGGYDALFGSRLAALSVIEREQLKNVRALGLQLVGYDIYQSFAVHKGDQALLSRLNEGLAVLHQTGEFEQIYAKWFGRFDSSLLTREQVLVYVGPLLIAALALAVFGYFHQRTLRRRLSKQAARLVESEALLAQAQRMAHVGHWRYDAVARTLSCSPEMLRILEQSPDQKHITYSRLLAMLLKPDRPIAHRMSQNALRNGVDGELTLSIYPRLNVRKVVHLKFHVVPAPAGGAAALVGTIQDITQQKIFEEDLRTREQLLRALYDNVPSALGVVEAAGDSFRFISANPGTAKLLGLDGQTVLAGRLISDLGLKPDVTAFWVHWFQRGLDYQEIFKAEPELDQGRRHLSLTLVPLGQASNGAAQVCFLAEDVSERKQIDAEIAQGRRLRAIGELVGGIAHEFNNLLTPILLKTEMLSAEWRTEVRLIEELRTISRAAERGADLTRRLLAFGRRSEPKPEEVKLRALVRANIDLLAPTIDRRIQLINDVPETLPHLFLNPSELHQIVLNLLLNARDTLVEKLNGAATDLWRATIRVEAAELDSRSVESALGQETSSPAGWLCLKVSDNGMGMPQAVLERIFEPFYSTKGVGKGTGLGLATVWHLTTRMGGKVTVQSRLSEGTVFQLWLPIVPGRKAAAMPLQERVEKTPRIDVRICLVEDDELVAQTVSALLRRQHHHVAHFRHGGDAWRHLTTRAADYDLLLLDLDLPGMNGMEIARRARSSRYSGKILIASGRLTETDARELEKIGVDHQLEKPFSPANLNLAIQSCMAGAERRISAPA